MNIRLTTCTVLTFFALLTACKHNAQDAQANATNAAATSAISSTAATPSADPAANSAAANQSAPSQSTSSPAPEVQEVTIPSGTKLSVRLRNTISSAESHSGDRFEAVLDQPLTLNNQTVVPAGVAIAGRVLDAESSGRLEHPGRISLGLTSMNLESGSVPVATSTVSAQGQGHKRRNLEWIGGSSAGGALLGGIFGGGKGAAIGAAAGAGAGTAGAAATGKENVSFAANSRLVFRLTRPITIEVKG